MNLTNSSVIYPRVHGICSICIIYKVERSRCNNYPLHYISMIKDIKSEVHYLWLDEAPCHHSLDKTDDTFPGAFTTFSDTSISSPFLMSSVMQTSHKPLPGSFEI